MTDEEKELADFQAALTAWLKAPRPKGAWVGAPQVNLSDADLGGAKLFGRLSANAP